MNFNSTETGAREPPSSTGKVSRGVLWFGFLGGAVAWMVQLLLIYLLGEFGCLTALHDSRLLGVTAVAWLGIAVTLGMFLISVSSGWVAYRGEKRLQLTGREEEEIEAELFLARAGWIAGILFSFVILVQSMPIFFYLQDC